MAQAHLPISTPAAGVTRCEGKKLQGFSHGVKRACRKGGWVGKCADNLIGCFLSACERGGRVMLNKGHWGRDQRLLLTPTRFMSPMLSGEQPLPRCSANIQGCPAVRSQGHPRYSDQWSRAFPAVSTPPELASLSPLPALKSTVLSHCLPVVCLSFQAFGKWNNF